MCGILSSLSLLIGLCEHASCRCVLNCKMVFGKECLILTAWWWVLVFRHVKKKKNLYKWMFTLEIFTVGKKDFALPFYIPLRCKWRDVQISNWVHWGLSCLRILLKMCHYSISCHAPQNKTPPCCKSWPCCMDLKAKEKYQDEALPNSSLWELACVANANHSGCLR